MSRIFVKTERVVPATPDEVYAAISDYKEKRPRMLTSNFKDYAVEKGGRGKGTIVRYNLHAARRERPYHIRVEEPVKGQVLTESDLNSSLVTTWTLQPVNNGQQTKVRVASEWLGGNGIGGFFERAFAPLGLRRIYKTMLSSLISSLLPTPTDETPAPVQTSETAASNRTEEGNVLTNSAVALMTVAGVIAFGYGLRYLLKRFSSR
jgi:hypothetical protein